MGYEPEGRPGRHRLGLWSLTATGIGSIIGSGWLFSAYYTAQYAGSGAYLAWILGAFIIILLALILAEVVTLHPKRGLFTRMLTLSHGHDLGYVTALANWLGVVAVIPTEAQATIQYLSTSWPAATPYLFTHHELTTLGLLLVALLVVGYGVLNYWGVKLFSKSNNVITFIKVVIPIVTAIVIMYAAYHPGNFTAGGQGLLPYGISSVFGAIMVSGIIYAFNGFQSITSFCAEAKDPEKNIPRAMIISIVLCLTIYLLLQTAFIGGIPSDMLANGWHALNFTSPIAELTTLLGLNVMSVILYADACISPSGTGIIFTGATTRMLTAMAQEKQAPSFFNVLHPKYHFSRRSLVFNICLSLGLLFVYRSWQSLVSIVSLFHVISYMACPIVLMRLRVIEANAKRRYRLPFASIICPLLFLLVTYLFCMTPEDDLILVTTVSAVFYVCYMLVHYRWNFPAIWKAVKRSHMFISFFIGLSILGYLGNPDKGGYDILPIGVFYFLVSALSLWMYYYLVYKCPIRKKA